MFRSTLLLILLSIMACLAQEPARPSRYAVLIGNSRYAHLQALPAAAEDLKTMQSALQNAGFHVKVIANTNYQNLFEGIAGKSAPYFTEMRPGDVCFFYYAGYAVEFNGDNYLVPADFDPKSPDGMNYGALSLSRVQEVLESKKARIKIIAIDASTDIGEFAPALRIGRGLALPDTTDTRQLMVAFSAAPGEPALYPGPGVTPFTRYLAAALEKPGLNIEAVFDDARRAVIKSTADRQQPFPRSNITETFYFHDPLPVKAELPPGVPKRNRKDRQEYVWIPSGKFQMGCVPSDPKCDDNEKPQHGVTISKGFWMGRTEVTADAYRRYIETAFDKKHQKMPEAPDWDRKWSIITAPINAVTWQQAKGYCEWAGGRLPTEAEWEYAARAGAQNEIYPLNSENSRDKANFMGMKGNDRYDYSAPVGSFDPNAFGLFDMSGNVWEWVNDWYSKTYYSESPAADPQGPASGNKHIVRGGSWFSDPAKHLRISLRNPTNDWGNTIGFRCLLDDTPATKELLQ